MAVTVCDLCKAEFPVSRSCLVKKQESLIVSGGRSSRTKEVTMTYLTCPRCGKEYPVCMDDAETQMLLEESTRVEVKIQHYKKLKKPVPQKLSEKRRVLNFKLGFKRQKLALKYGKSFHQLEDGTLEQLEFCYHAQ